MSNASVLNLTWFLISASLNILSLVSPPYINEIFSLPSELQSKWTYLVITSATLLILLCCLYRGFNFQTTIRSHLLATEFAIGAYGAAVWSDVYSILGWYLCVLSMFHFSEFISIAMCNPKTVSESSFVLNHSREYWIALAASWLEFAVESYTFPSLKTFRFFSWFGLFLCISGEVLRKVAMFTAANNFNHLVQLQKEEDHCLVTHGVYRLCRHPSYLGWYFWSIGTQFLLLNPLCVVAYALVSWNFFRERIMVEEMYLLSFFKEDYVRYQERVGTGLPFIYGLTKDYGFKWET